MCVNSLIGKLNYIKNELQIQTKMYNVQYKNYLKYYDLIRRYKYVLLLINYRLNILKNTYQWYAFLRWQSYSAIQNVRPVEKSIRMVET